jgi:hypothetical protein
MTEGKIAPYCSAGTRWQRVLSMKSVILSLSKDQFSRSTLWARELILTRVRATSSG